MKHALDARATWAARIFLSGWIVLAAAPGAAFAAKPSSWDQIMKAGARFVVLADMGDQAVLDLETGLVWEQSPSASLYDWFQAQYHCNFLVKGGRLGWRLPSIQELASLVDPAVASPGPTLPSGHPFSGVQNAFARNYWSSTTQAVLGDYAWAVSFYLGAPADWQGPGIQKKDVATGNHAWCVRGGPGGDPQ